MSWFHCRRYLCRRLRQKEREALIVRARERCLLACDAFSSFRLLYNSLPRLSRNEILVSFFPSPTGVQIERLPIVNRPMMRSEGGREREKIETSAHKRIENRATAFFPSSLLLLLVRLPSICSLSLSGPLCCCLLLTIDIGSLFSNSSSIPL